jgi:hypothetical protein
VSAERVLSFLCNLSGLIISYVQNICFVVVVELGHGMMLIKGRGSLGLAEALNVSKSIF